MYPINKSLPLVILIGVTIAAGASGTPDYHDALDKCLVFFEAQRSGKLPPGHHLPWRADSGLNDGQPEHVDLTGGYYDAGDNIKFGLPMAFTTTMLSWSVLEFGRRMPPAQLEATRQAVRWGSDYLLKASVNLPQALYVQVGNPYEEHNCWQRAEAETAPKPVYKVTPSNPGSDVAGETAAALAAASMVFRPVDRAYSRQLAERAAKAFDFANKYRGKYTDSLSSVACPFYCSYSGYEDELLWAAAWLYHATRNASYLDLAKSLGLNSDCDAFSWDNKYPGARVLLAKDFLVGKNAGASEFKAQADKFVCSVVPTSPSVSVKYTPGGLLYKMEGSNMQYVTSTSFLLAAYAKYLRQSGDRAAAVQCGGVAVTAAALQDLVRKQVDYILGSNAKGMSYMVGFGKSFPQHVHHRGASIPTNAIGTLGTGEAACHPGFQYFYAAGPNPNVLTGAVVGGPDANDGFADDRNNFAQSEPATYINAPLIGTLAFVSSHAQRQ